MAFVLWSAFPLSGIFEDKAFDNMQRIRYKFHGPVLASNHVGLVVIDDQSVDPAYSPFSDPWGSGRWRTREQYTQQMAILTAGRIKPAVLAYDLLFPPAVSPSTDERAERLAKAQQLRHQTPDILKILLDVEIEGNNAIQNELFLMQDLREAGEQAPYPVFAYLFTVDEGSRQLARSTLDQRREQFKALTSELLPDGLVKGLGSAHKTVNLPAEEIRLAKMGLGSINVAPDPGGVVRRVPLIYPVEDPDTGQIRYAPSLALRSLFAYWKILPQEWKSNQSGLPSFSAVAGEEIVLRTEFWTKRIPVDEQFRLLINARCRFPDTKAKPYADVTRYGMELVPGLQSQGLSESDYKERSSEARRMYDYLHEKIVLVAQAFTGSGDIGNFPLEENTPNAMAHFYVMDNILRDDYLRPFSLGLGVLICFVCASTAVGCYSTLGTFKANLVLVFFMVSYPLLVLFGVDHLGRVFPLITPILLMVALLAFNNFYVYLTEEKEKRLIRKMFSTMVSPRVLQWIDENPEEFGLRGKKAEATMFFSDLAGFTSISEKVSAEELSALLNRYLTPMTDIIMESDGYLDKYSGDGIMAVWGVPYPDKAHALAACRSALKQQEQVQVLAEEIHRELGIVISVRMGINSGQVSAGSMGSEKRFQYTVMGDAVNLAARLEPVNKDYGTRIILGQETRKRIEGSFLLTRCLDKMVVKGKTEPVLIYELVGEQAPGEAVPSWIGSYEKGLDLLWKQDWEQAAALFQACLALREDAASRLMLERIEFYRKNPPGTGWDGAFVRKAKD